MSVPYCSDYCNFVVSFGIRKSQFSIFGLLFQGFFFFFGGVLFEVLESPRTLKSLSLLGHTLGALWVLGTQWSCG